MSPIFPAVVAGVSVLLIVVGLATRRSHLESLVADLEVEPAADGSRIDRLVESFLRNLALAGWNFTFTELAWMELMLVVVLSLAFIAIGKLGFLAVPLAIVIAISSTYAALRISQVRREAKVEHQLVQALVVITSLMGASGATLQRAVAEASERIPPPLGPELARISEIERLGGDFASAVEEAGQRLGSKEWDFVAKATKLQQEQGGDIVLMLTKMVDTLTARIQARGQARALLAEAQMSKYFLAAATPGAIGLLAIDNPSQAHALLGHDLWMTILSLVLWLGGLVVMSFMTKRITYT